jgi:ribonuclease-3
MKKSYAELYRRLGYQFQNTALLEAALSHRSFKGNNNERLEFLGDSIVNFVIAAALFERCPHAKEGELSRLRASLVRGETLAELALEFNLGEYLRLGAGELKSGGWQRKSILADALEAVIAAIYLDAGLAICQSHVLRWFEQRLANVLEVANHKDPKSLLQEYLQARKLALPAYVITDILGEAHQQVFHVQCALADLSITTQGSGSSRREAEQQAAQQALTQINSSHAK